MENQPNPNTPATRTKATQEHALFAAQEEVLAVLRKYDLAALITLVSEDQMLTTRELSPSWSMAKLTVDPVKGVCISINGEMKNFPDETAYFAHIAKTAGMFLKFQHQATQDLSAMECILGGLSEFVNIRSRLRIVTPGE